MIDLYKTLLYTSNIAVSRTGSYYTFYLQSRPGKQSEIKKTVIHLAVYITDMIQDACDKQDTRSTLTIPGTLSRTEPTPDYIQL